MKENQHATKRSRLVEKQKDFSDQKRIDSQRENSLSGDGCRGTAGVERSTRQNFVASKLKVNFFVLLRVALSALKNSVNSVGTLRVRSGKESFGFKKLLELIWTLVYVFQRSVK